MTRTLWLKADQTSESDTILHPATADQVALALNFLEALLTNAGKQRADCNRCWIGNGNHILKQSVRFRVIARKA